MTEAQLDIQEIARRGQALYDERIRPLVETEANVGKHLALDVPSGDYEIAERGIEASRRLRDRHPEGLFYRVRIGYDAVYGHHNHPRRLIA